MSDKRETPRTDAVLRIANNFGAFPGDVADGVTPQEAHDHMEVALERLARQLETELAEAREREALYKAYYEADRHWRTLPQDLPSYNAAMDVVRAEQAIKQFLSRHEGGR